MGHSKPADRNAQTSKCSAAPMRLGGGFLAIFRQIAPHIPVWDKSVRSDGTFSRADFVFDRSRSRRDSEAYDHR